MMTLTWCQPLADAVHVGFAHLDDDLRHVTVNEAYAQWLKRDPDGLLGESVESVLGPEAHRLLLGQVEEVELPMGVRCIPLLATDRSSDGWLVVRSVLEPQVVIDRILQAQEEERRRLARELHDGAGQALSSVCLRLGELETTTDLAAAQREAGDLRKYVLQTLDELDRMAKALHPHILEELGFAEALANQATEVGRTHHIDIDLQLVGIENDALPESVAGALYRIIQEALSNVVSHAEAQTVNVVVQREANHIRAIVEDDGRGFDVTQPTRGIGLLGIQERVSLLGGTANIEAVPGDGTTVVVRIPLQQAAS